MISTIAVAGGAFLLGKYLLSLKDSAEKLIFNLAGARFKGNSLDKGITGGLLNPRLNFELLFNVSNPGNATIKLDFLMLDAVLKMENGNDISIGQVRLEELDTLRKSNPTAYTFPANKTNTFIVPISIQVYNFSNAQALWSIINGTKITGIQGKGYLKANGVRIEINEVKQFDKPKEEEEE